MIYNIKDSSSTGSFFGTDGEYQGVSLLTTTYPIGNFEKSENMRKDFDFMHTANKNYDWLPSSGDLDSYASHNQDVKSYDPNKGYLEHIRSIGSDYYIRRRIWIDSGITNITRMQFELLQGPKGKSFDKMAVKARLTCSPPLVGSL